MKLQYILLVIMLILLCLVCFTTKEGFTAATQQQLTGEGVNQEENTTLQTLQGISTIRGFIDNPLDSAIELISGDSEEGDGESGIWGYKSSVYNQYQPIECEAYLVGRTGVDDENSWSWNGMNPEPYNRGERVNTLPSDSNYKKRCTSCLNAKDKAMFVDEFYTWYCDAMRGCTDPNVKMWSDMKPFIYAINSVDWDQACRGYYLGFRLSDGETATNPYGKPLNWKQRATCGVFNNIFADMIMLGTKAISAECSAEIVIEQPISDTLSQAADEFFDLFD